MSLNNEKRKSNPFLIDLNLAEPKYYAFIISLDEYNGSYNSAKARLHHTVHRIRFPEQFFYTINCRKHCIYTQFKNRKSF